jgi:hypothetical protein
MKILNAQHVVYNKNTNLSSSIFQKSVIAGLISSGLIITHTLQVCESAVVITGHRKEVCLASSGI